MNTKHKEAKKCGFVAIIGAPNAGKSTLLNKFIGQKLSIVSHKVQTTRNRIRGIGIFGDTQIVFIDTPGIFNAKQKLEEAMVDSALAGLEEADEIVYVMDAKKGVSPDDLLVIEILQQRDIKAILALNKTDTIKKDLLLPLAEKLFNMSVFSDIFMIQAKSGDSVDHLIHHLVGLMPEEAWHYGEEDITDIPMRLLAAEITREKVFLMLHEELPYDITVETEEWESFDNGEIRIGQIIHVAKESQKKIVIGGKGHQIKKIRERAQRDIAEMMASPVHLFLEVKVTKDWKEKPSYYRAMGLSFPK